jgi:cytoskeletal protein CcmA (bactofilin family)
MAIWAHFTRKGRFPSETEKAGGSLSTLGLTSRRDESSEISESLIAPGLTIEGRIEGAGNLRVAGHLKGEVCVGGDLTVEPGAHIRGEIWAVNVVVKGTVKGNIHALSRVKLLESALLIGDVKASSLTIAAGSSIRGKIKIGSDQEEPEQLAASEGGESS